LVPESPKDKENYTNQIIQIQMLDSYLKQSQRGKVTISWNLRMHLAGAACGTQL
jgi:hypothetical protein